MKLRNAGRKTTEELEAFCQNLMNSTGPDFVEFQHFNPVSQQNNWVKEIAPANLSLKQIHLLDAQTRQLYNSLSARSQNALDNFFKKELNYANIHHFFFEKKIQKGHIAKVGNKSFKEIEVFVSKIRSIAEEVKIQSDEVLEVNFFAKKFCQALSLPEEFIEPYLPDRV